MRVRLTTDPDDRIVLESPFDSLLVERLKGAIPAFARTWDMQRKRWLISPLYSDRLLQVLESLGATVHDARTPEHAMVATPLEDACAALYLTSNAPLCVAEASYRALVKIHHPDHGGVVTNFHRIHDAMCTIRDYYVQKKDASYA